jgi:L-lactate dehydrogenase complex protein LldG
MSASSREQILAALRAGRAPHDHGTVLPEPFAGGIRYPDPVAQFAEALAQVGGRAVVLSSEEALPTALGELDVLKEARRMACGEGMPTMTGSATRVDLHAVADPRTLAELDVMVAPGRMAVAENGAVWVSGHDVAQPAALFLCQHLVLVVRVATLTHNLHEAYAQLALGDAGYGVFISGPSKTADIEQSLVIGAHGPRSATVFLV